MDTATATKTVSLKINGTGVQVPEGTSILEAAKKAQVKIPVLCTHADLLPSGSCGLCIVKIKGMAKQVRACATAVAENMEVITHDPELYETRRTVLELILSNHPDDCLRCQRNNNCELQRLAAEFGIRESRFAKKLKNLPKDTSTTSLILDPQKCILCGRCVSVCQNMQNVWALEFIGRGYDMRIAPAGDIKLNDSPCIKCGSVQRIVLSGRLSRRMKSKKCGKVSAIPKSIRSFRWLRLSVLRLRKVSAIRRARL
jgi:NADH-quinone oxidoreductase subunit G